MQAWDHPSPFILSVSPLGTDIDGLNHTNNAVYVRWCEQAAWAHSESLGLSLADYQQLDRALVIAQAEYQYLAASYLGDELELATHLLNCDNKMRIERHFQIIRKVDQVVILRAQWNLLCIEISSGKPKRMPASFRDIYGSACAI